MTDQHTITIEIRDTDLARAREAYPNTMPTGSPEEWDERQLRRALDILIPENGAQIQRHAGEES